MIVPMAAVTWALLFHFCYSVVHGPKWRTRSSWIAGSWSCCRTRRYLKQKQQQKIILIRLRLANIFQRAVAMSERYIGRAQRGFLLLRLRCDCQPDPWVTLLICHRHSSYKWRRRYLLLPNKTPTCKTTTTLLNNGAVCFVLLWVYWIIDPGTLTSNSSLSLAP